MLAEFLQSHRRELIRNVESLAAAEPGQDPSAEGRGERLDVLAEELIESLLRGGVAEPWPEPSPQAAVEQRERELVRLGLDREVEQYHLAISPSEMHIVSDWVYAKDWSRSHERMGWLSHLLDAVDESAAILAPDCRILYVNRQAASMLHELTGVAHDAFVGRTPADLGVPLELDAVCSPDQLVAVARAAKSTDVNVRGRWNEQRASPLYGPDGRIVAVAITFHDIHQRRLDSLRFSVLSKLSMLVGSVEYHDVPQALAHAAVPELADWCVVHSVEGNRIAATFVAQREGANEALRDEVERVVSRWDRHTLWQEMLTSGFQLLTEVSDPLLRKVAPDEETYRVLARVGVRSLHVFPIVCRGEIAGIVTLAYTAESGRRYGRDDPRLAEEFALHAAHIIENARLLEELRASETRFRVALAGSNTSVFEQDTALRYKWHFNPLSPSDRIGKGHEAAFSQEDSEVLTRLKQPVLERGECTNDEVALTMGGQRRIYRQRMEPMRDRAGKVVGLIGSAVDITEEKRKEEQLHQALGFRDRVMGILAHDLRNPLSAVTMAVGAVLRRPDVPEDARSKIRIIQHSAKRMSEMIETLLDFAGLQSSGGMRVVPVSSDLGELAEQIVAECRTAHPGRTIDLVARGDLRIECDPARISQAISNLLANAVTYGDPKAPVWVSVDGEGADAAITVHNEGAPIPADVMPLLYEPFTRGASDTATRRGLGLGLYIVKQIVIAHVGTIEVESTARAGTTFTVRLPRTSKR